MTAVLAVLNYLLHAAGPPLVRIAVAVVLAGALTGGLCRRIGLAADAIPTLVRTVALGVALALGGLELWLVLLQAADASLQWWPVLAAGQAPGVHP